MKEACSRSIKPIMSKHFPNGHGSSVKWIIDSHLQGKPDNSECQIEDR